ncbi:MAG: phosphoglucosamine mutase [Phycisphaerales bacterium JB063]
MTTTPKTTDAPLMLSISGMRGLIGLSLTPDVATRYATAFGNWLSEPEHRRPGHDPASAPHVVLGRDSRASGPMLEHAAVAGLIAAGCRVTRVGVLSTPGVAVMADQLQADGGMVITASHNPFPWNGIKALRHDGVAPPPDQAHDIIRRFRENDLAYAGVADLQDATQDDTGTDIHVQRVLELVDTQAIRDAKLSAVVDSVHGAGGPEARALLDALGVTLHHLYAEPTGDFPHVPEPTQENLTELCAVVKDQKADIGFAQDPDADRLAVVDELGNYIGEEYTLALCALHKLGQGDAVAANLSTSRMVDDVAQSVGGTVIRTPVGEANVTQGMRSHGATLGGEGNGGIIDNRVSQVRDSLIGMAYLCEMLAARKQPLSAIVDEQPRYAIVKDKAGIDPAVLEAMPAKMADAFADQRIDTQDGIRVDWDDRWVHVRPSNTEPIIRVIAEARGQAEAKALVAQVREVLGL